MFAKDLNVISLCVIHLSPFWGILLALPRFFWMPENLYLTREQDGWIVFWLFPSSRRWKIILFTMWPCALTFLSPDYTFLVWGGRSQRSHYQSQFQNRAKDQCEGLVWNKQKRWKWNSLSRGVPQMFWDIRSQITMRASLYIHCVFLGQTARLGKSPRVSINSAGKNRS